MPKRREETINEAVHFDPEDFFFSVTDARGIILGGNEVFVRVSEYALEELVGSNHNIIRHPDMPRAVFRLLWQTIQSGQSISAYVKNCSKSGRYYWVVANVFCLGDKYLSVRFQPGTALWLQVQGLYQEMLAAEAAGSTREEGIQAATALLQQRLAQLGFADYREFQWHLLMEELERLDQVRDERAALRVRVPPSAGLAGKCREWGLAYRGLFQEMKALRPIAEATAQQSSFLSQLAHDIRIHAINSSVAATRIGGEGRTLGAVSRALGQLIEAGERDIQAGSTHAKACQSQLRGAALAVCQARILLEMLPEFAATCMSLHASSAHPPGKPAPQKSGRLAGQVPRALPDSGLAHKNQEAVLQNLRWLWELLAQLSRTVQTDLHALAHTFEGHARLLEVIERLNQVLGLIRVSGSTELSRLPQAEDFRAVFARLAAAVADTGRALREFQETCTQARQTIRRGQALAETLLAQEAEVARNLPAEVTRA